MRWLTIHEHERIWRGEVGDRAREKSLEPALYERLRATDRGGKGVFEWHHEWCKATHWVGVVRAPGVQVEILPKTDAFSGEEGGDEPQQRVRSNLLFMLAIGGDIPIRTRDLARLCARRAPLIETLVTLFADQLREELLRGLDRGYQEHEENLRQFKGKLLISRQVQANAARRDRFHCRHDEFSADTRLNRIFKTCCRQLLGLTSSASTEDTLRQSLHLLSDVSDAAAQVEELNKISLTRQNERFAELLTFCRLLLEGRSPLGHTGATTAFSVLFDMNRVFERFLAAFLQREVLPRLEGVALHTQGTHHRRFLMEHQGKGILQLKPDLLLEGPGARKLVMDTKWKLLTPGGRSDVGREDLYQLFAYVHRYACERSVLLYPHLSGLSPREFVVLDEAHPSSKEVWVRTLKLHPNLHKEEGRQQLASDLEAIVRAGLQLSSAAS